MDNVFYIYLVSEVIAIVIGYLGCRTIDFMFTKSEDKRRYSYAKGCIQCYNDGQKRMAQSLTKTINDNLLETFQKMEDL